MCPLKNCSCQNRKICFAIITAKYFGIIPVPCIIASFALPKISPTSFPKKIVYPSHD
jgi:hypothetical protein